MMFLKCKSVKVTEMVGKLLYFRNIGLGEELLLLTFLDKVKNFQLPCLDLISSPSIIQIVGGNFRKYGIQIRIS